MSYRYGVDVLGAPVSSAPSLADVRADKAVIKRGMSGDSVVFVQKALGFTGSDVDGVFGKKTENGVKAYQTAHGLPVDGVVGIHTIAAMDFNNVTAPANSPNALLDPYPQGSAKLSSPPSAASLAAKNGALALSTGASTCAATGWTPETIAMVLAIFAVLFCISLVAASRNSEEQAS